MPQVTKGGKFIFGWSSVRENGRVFLPKQAIIEYGITCEGRVILFTGSKSTGGFCVTRKGLWQKSKLGFVLEDSPEIMNYTAPPFSWKRVKGRSYCWATINADGELVLPPEARSFLRINIGDKLLSIRSSDIAFTMGHHGQLVERASAFEGEIYEY